jgi:hypothetical protein
LFEQLGDLLRREDSLGVLALGGVTFQERLDEFAKRRLRVLTEHLLAQLDEPFHQRPEESTPGADATPLAGIQSEHGDAICPVGETTLGRSAGTRPEND